MTKADNIFAGSLKRGEIGEEIFLSNFAGMKSVKKVYDARHSDKYQDMDIDFVLDLRQKSKLIDSTRISVELKTDYTTHENVYYELYSCYELHTAGCMEKTKSELLIYYYIRKNFFYVLKTDTFRDWVHVHSEEFRKNFKEERGRGRGIYHKAGLLIPTSSIEAACENKKIIGKKVQVSDAFSNKRVAMLDDSSCKIEILRDKRKVKNIFDDMD